MSRTTDSSGAGTLYRYGPYGEPESWSGPRFRYTGQAVLSELHLYHYKARAYDPLLGRFLQTDAVGYEDDLNLYAYVRNDPLNLLDPTGQAPNKQHATDYRYVASLMEEGGLAPLRQDDRTTGRYFHTETYGWVDVRHFGEAAARVLIDGWDPGAVLIAGYGVEVSQELMEGPNDYRSGFSPEDLPSNRAGVDFAEFVQRDTRGSTLSQSFERWARSEGATEFGDPTFEDAFANLPETDPSRRKNTRPTPNQ